MASTNPTEQAFLKDHSDLLDEITIRLFKRLNIPPEDWMSLFMSSCIGNILARLSVNIVEDFNNPFIEEDYQKMIGSLMQETSEFMVQRLEEEMPKLNRKIDLN